MKIRLKALFAAAALAALMSGCATTTGTDRMEKVEQNLKDGRESMKVVKKNVTSSLNILKSMQRKDADLKAFYSALVENVDTIVETSEKLKMESRRFKVLFRERFDHWKLSVNKITDEDLRDDSRGRMEDELEEYEDFFELLDDAETIMDPLTIKLTNIKKFLDLDLSRTSVKDISKYAERARSNADDVIEWIDEVTEEINELIGPSVVPAE